MRRRFFLIYNPAAGRDRRLFLETVVRHMETAGATIVRCQGTSADAARAEASAAARSGQFDAVVAAGGDGTIRQAAIAVRETACPLGALMIGTGNVLAHELDLPRTPAEIAAMLMRGPAIELELGVANGEPFLLMVGAGFDGRVIGHLNQSLKQRFARAAFGPATFSALRAPLDRLHVDVDGTTHACAWIIVTNAARYGGSFQLTQRTSLRERGLVAILFHARTRAELVAQAVALSRGQLDQRAVRDPGWVTMQACTRARITAAHGVPVQIDGDSFGTTPLDIGVGGGQVHLIVPEVRK